MARCGIKHGYGDQTCAWGKGHGGLCRSMPVWKDGVVSYTEWESENGEFKNHVGYREHSFAVTTMHPGKVKIEWPEVIPGSTLLDLGECPTTPGVEIEQDAEYLTLDGHYHIEWSRIQNPMELLVWVLHLGEKTWMGHKDIKRFVTVVCKHRNWDIPWNC